VHNTTDLSRTMAEAKNARTTRKHTKHINAKGKIVNDKKSWLFSYYIVGLLYFLIVVFVSGIIVFTYVKIEGAPFFVSVFVNIVLGYIIIQLLVAAFYITQKLESVGLVKLVKLSESQ